MGHALVTFDQSPLLEPKVVRCTRETFVDLHRVATELVESSLHAFVRISFELSDALEKPTGVHASNAGRTVPPKSRGSTQVGQGVGSVRSRRLDDARRMGGR